MARVAMEEQGVTIRLNWVDEVLALHGSLHIPYRHIVGVSTEEIPEAWLHGIRVGTNLPGMKVAGTYSTEDGMIFCVFRDRAQCLTLELTHERYVRVVVEIDPVQNREALKEEIRARVRASSQSK